jgi:hypothetical protein
MLYLYANIINAGQITDNTINSMDTNTQTCTQGGVKSKGAMFLKPNSVMLKLGFPGSK